MYEETFRIQLTDKRLLCTYPILLITRQCFQCVLQPLIVWTNARHQFLLTRHIAAGHCHRIDDNFLVFAFLLLHRQIKRIELKIQVNKLLQCLSTVIVVAENAYLENISHCFHRTFTLFDRFVDQIVDTMLYDFVRVLRKQWKRMKFIDDVNGRYSWTHLCGRMH